MKNKLTPEDQDLFRHAMRGVKPLAKTKIKVSPKPPAIKLKPRRPALPGPAPMAIAPFSDHLYLDPVTSEDHLSFARSGISAKSLRIMRRGQETIEAILDLHGKTVEEARLSLHQFLLACQQQGKTKALIIHGKGRAQAKPILKNKLNHWLRQSEQVLAFCSASKKDGGAGALYLRLKRS